jgi:hypothetical protein
MIAFARSSLRDREASQKGAGNVISNCINAMFLQSLDPCWTSHLVECIRELDSLSASISGSLALEARRLKERVSREYESLISREC